MKKRVKQLIFVATLVSLAGCKDFLTENPTENLFPPQIYANRETAYTAVIGCYQKMAANNYYGSSWTEAFLPSSIFVTTGIDPAGNNGATQLEMANMASYNISPDNSSGVASPWAGVYQAIGRCNIAIAGIEGSSGISNDDKLKLIGEVRFLRAVSYFNVVRMWGRAPMPLAPASSISDAHHGRVGVDTLFNAIIDDFKYAEENMPTKSEQVWGKPFNYAATAFLAKVYAAMATSEYLFVGRHDPWAGQREGYWKDSYDAAKKVYDAKVYSLMPNYNDLWMGKNKSSHESIFEIQYNSETGGNGWAWGTYPGNTVLTPNSANLNNANRGRIRGTRAVWNLQVAKYTTADPRLAANYITGGYVQPNANAPAGDIVNGLIWLFPTDTIPNTSPVKAAAWGFSFPCLKKYIDPKWVNSGSASVNWMVYRYADLMLTMAEAANEIGDPDNLKFRVVNEVLKRARDSAPGSTEPADWQPSAQYNTKDGFRQAVMAERLFELPCEGHEWFDVRRRGVPWFRDMAIGYNTDLDAHPRNADVNAQGVSRVKAVHVPTDTMTVRKLLLMPIPNTEFNANVSYSGNKDQNFGY